MSIFDSLIGSLGLTRKAAQMPNPGNFQNADPLALFASTKKMAAAKAMAVNNNWVYACVRAISEELANARFRLFEIKKDGTREEVFDHEILTALESVNGYQTGYELRYLLGSHLELTGNAFWLLDGVKNEKSIPKAIYPLNPAFVKVQRGDMRNPVLGYSYAAPNRKPEFFQTYEILHLKYPDPSDNIEGIGTVQSIAQWIDSENFATEWNRNFFLNGARIGGFLDTENALNKEQLEFLRHNFEDIYKGVDNAHKVAVLPKGVKYTAGSESVKELDFNQGQIVLRDKILAGFRVPKTILGASESETNRATAETANYVFAARTITPKLRLITSYLNEFFVPRYGDRFFLEFATVIPEDRLQRVAEMTAATGGSPVISVNEAREDYMGLGPIENGDDVMTNYAQVPLGAPKQATTTVPVRKTNSAPIIKSRGFRNAERRSQLSADIAKNAINVALEALTSKRKNISEFTDDEFEPIYKAFASRVTPFETAFKKAIIKFNGKQEKVVLENVGDATKAVDEGALFELEDWIGSLVDLATPILTDLYAKEALEAAKLLGRDDIDVVTPETKKALAKAIELMARSYNETTLALLATKLEQGLQDGLDQPALKNLVKEVYEFSDDRRALMVARTESFRIANGATHDAWKASGVVKTYKWYTAVDERVCEFCEPMMGKTIGIDDTFFPKGGKIEGRDGGEMSADYSSIEYPPLHPECRCYVRPDEIEI